MSPSIHFYRAKIAYTYQGRRVGAGKIVRSVGPMPAHMLTVGRDAERNPIPQVLEDCTGWAAGIPSDHLEAFMREHAPVNSVVSFAEG